jgi:hypothetical protein
MVRRRKMKYLENDKHDAATTAGFDYAPLADGHLRLLDLQWDKDDKHPQVTIQTYPMDKAPPFEALSYAWGDSHTSRPIRCVGGGFIHLSVNLYCAIHNIIRPGGRRLMWIDQICIDQDNAVEKAVQVALMGRIFSTATRVLVWLGDAPPAAEPGFEFLTKLLDALHAVVEKGENFEDFDLNGLAKFSLPDKYHVVWFVVWELFNSHWFRRLWVMQEATLAKQLRFYSGSNAIEWDLLRNLAVAIRDVASVYRLNPYMDRSSRQDAFWNLEIIRYLRECRRSGGEEGQETDLTLSDLVEYSAGKLCALEEDKIYALFGLLKSEEQRKLVIDYTKPIHQIHFDAFRVAIETDPTLSLLNLPFVRDRSTGLPSWCPILDIRTEAFRLRKDLYEAARFKNPPKGAVRFKDKSRLLRLEGAPLGRIKEVISSKHPSRKVWANDGIDAYNSQSLTFERDCFFLASHTLEGRERETMEPHWRTLTADASSYQGGRATSAMGQAYKVWKTALEEKKSVGAKGEVKAGEFLEFHGAMLSACGGRRYFATDSRKLGLGPEGCKAGDIVVLFLGAYTPFVVRPNYPNGNGYDQTYTFVGECYVHGFMDGEAEAMIEDGDLEVQNFVLD